MFNVRLVFVPALMAAMWSLDAYAQTPDAANKSQSSELYRQAVKEIAQKNYPVACPKLEESIRLDSESLDAKVALAECYEKWDKLASAHAAYLRAEQAATA